MIALRSQPVAPGDETEWADGLLERQQDLSQRLDCLAAELVSVNDRLTETVAGSRSLHAKLALILQVLESRSGEGCRRV